MKRNIITAILILWTCSSCSDWLDVNPRDQVGEGDLFDNGEGYRTALNGVYQQLSGEELYGKNMTWGFVECLGQVYDPEKLLENDPLRNAMKLNYNNEASVKFIETIWSKMYNSIANCNNIIGHIENSSADIFDYKEQEQKMIQAEAYALRGFLHLDILRLFAPAVKVANEAKYIPYQTSYPALWGEKKSVKEILDLVIADLLKARKISVQDTLPDNVESLTKSSNRFGNGNNWPDRGTFWAMRGTRMNYHNITALLARTYLYAGNLEEAYKYASEVLAIKDPSAHEPAYPYQTNLGGNRKSKDDILLAFYNRKVTDYHKKYFGENELGEGGYLHIRHLSDLFSDNNDYRYSQMSQAPAEGIRVCYKYKIEEENTNERDNGPIIPVLRMGEMTYIVSEYQAEKGNIPEAANLINTNIRLNRGCTAQISTELEKVLFMNELLLDARREFLEEGQIFFMYKRLNQPIWDGTKNDPTDMSKSFVLPIPDSENI